MIARQQAGKAAPADGNDVMALEDGEAPDANRVQDMVTYDIVPELESYLHSIGKQLHGSIEEQ